MVGLAQLPSRQSRRSQRLPISHKASLHLSKKLIPKHHPNPGRHASQSINNSSTPLSATSPSHPNSDLNVGLLARAQQRPRSRPHGVTSQRIPQDERTPAAQSAQRGFFHVRGRPRRLALRSCYDYVLGLCGRMKDVAGGAFCSLRCFAALGIGRIWLSLPSIPCYFAPLARKARYFGHRGGPGCGPRWPRGIWVQTRNRCWGRPFP